MLTPEQLKLLDTIAEGAKMLDMRVFLVGGVVRDLLGGGTIHERDLDFIVEGSAANLAQWVAERIGGKVVLWDKFLTAKVQHPTGLSTIEEIDFATARSETYPKPGSLPLVEATTIENDLRRRDFSVNAIALPVDYVRQALVSSAAVNFGEAATHAVDVCGGLADLQRRVLRTIHQKSFEDDPTRIFRAMRYMARLDASLDQATRQQLETVVQGGGLRTISAQRVKNELQKLCDERSWAQALKHGEQYNLLVASDLMPAGRKLFPSIDPLLGPIDTLSGAGRLSLILRLGLYARPQEERKAFVTRFSLARKVAESWIADEEMCLRDVWQGRAQLRSLSVEQLISAWWLRGSESEDLRSGIKQELYGRHECPPTNNGKT